MLETHYCFAGVAGGELPQGSMLTLLWPWIIIMGIFYLLIFRPQRLKQKELEKMLSALEKNDRVVTSGGLIGIVTGLKDRTVMVKIAENVKVEVLRSSITQVEKATKANEREEKR